MPMDNLNNDEQYDENNVEKIYCPDGARLETTGTPSRLIKKYMEADRYSDFREHCLLRASGVHYNRGYCGARENLEKDGFQKCSPGPTA